MICQILFSEDDVGLECYFNYEVKTLVVKESDDNYHRQKCCLKPWWRVMYTRVYMGIKRMCFCWGRKNVSNCNFVLLLIYIHQSRKENVKFGQMELIHLLFVQAVQVAHLVYNHVRNFIPLWSTLIWWNISQRGTIMLNVNPVRSAWIMSRIKLVFMMKTVIVLLTVYQDFIQTLICTLVTNVHSVCYLVWLHLVLLMLVEIFLSLILAQFQLTCQQNM